MSPVIASHNHTGVRGAAASQDRTCPSNGYVLYASYAIKSLESLLDFSLRYDHISGALTVDTKLSEYVKIAEAAKILGVSQGTLRNWAEAGKIPMHKNPVNGYRLFRRDELTRFLADVAKPYKRFTPKAK